MLVKVGPGVLLGCCSHVKFTKPPWWLVKIGSGNSLMPDGTKPLLPPMMTYHQRCSVASPWGKFHRKTYPVKSVWKITHLRFTRPETQAWTNNCVHWNLSITTTLWDTSLPSGAHLGGQGPPRWAPEGRHFSTSKLVPSVFIKTHYWINHS